MMTILLMHSQVKTLNLHTVLVYTVPSRKRAHVWAWLRSLAMYDHSFVLKRGIKLARLSFTAV